MNEKLVPFLPKNPIIQQEEKCYTAISSAPYGSALVCLISYGYIVMMGAEGLTNATKYAILNANYMKARFEGHYPIFIFRRNGKSSSMK